MDHWIERAVDHQGELKPDKKAPGLMDGSANQSFDDLKRNARPNSSIKPPQAKGKGDG